MAKFLKGNLLNAAVEEIFNNRVRHFKKSGQCQLETGESSSISS
jgi:hypothetical protein